MFRAMSAPPRIFDRDLHRLRLERAAGGYAGFLREVVIPDPTVFAFMVILGELLVGILLVLGLFTAPACLLGAFMNLNYMVALLPGGIAPVGLNLSFVVMQLVLAFAYAGTTWGIDGRLVGRIPWWTQGLLHYEYREF